MKIATASPALLGIATVTVMGGFATITHTPRTLDRISLRAAQLDPIDFNGDGHSDVAVGAVNRTVSKHANAGAVDVIYGGGTFGKHRQVLTQATKGIFGKLTSNAHFGSITATGDVDGDGFTDLAIALPNQRVSGSGPATNRGVVIVLHGSESGLRTKHPEVLYAGVDAIHQASSSTDRFGAAIAFGNVSSSPADCGSVTSCDSLLIGVPGFDGGSGEVVVVPGTQDGLASTQATDFTGKTSDIPVGSDNALNFGRALRVGDFNGDSVEDLIVSGDVQDDADTVSNHFYDIPGSAQGPNFAAATQIDASELDGMRRGISADFNGDGSDDFVGYGSGHVVLVNGSFSGLDVSTKRTYTAEDLKEPSCPTATFGSALAVGDVNHDGRSDLAIGDPHACLAGNDARHSAGSVTLLLGSSTGLATIGRTILTQDSRGVRGHAAVGDQFGYSLSFSNVTGDSRSDLLVGVPHDNDVKGGSLAVFPGAKTGISVKNDLLIAESGKPTKHHSDRFGATLTGH